MKRQAQWRKRKRWMGGNPSYFLISFIWLVFLFIKKMKKRKKMFVTVASVMNFVFPYVFCNCICICLLLMNLLFLEVYQFSSICSINGVSKVQGGRACMSFLCWSVRQWECLGNYNFYKPHPVSLKAKILFYNFHKYECSMLILFLGFTIFLYVN